MIFAAVFAWVVGLSMIWQWSHFYRARQIPELASEPIRIGFHLAAEMITALCLLVSGMGLLTNQDWSIPLYLVASGMLFYTAIVSPGYFAQRGEWRWLGIFAAILILGVVGVLQL